MGTLQDAARPSNAANLARSWASPTTSWRARCPGWPVLLKFHHNARACDGSWNIAVPRSPWTGTASIRFAASPGRSSPTPIDDDRIRERSCTCQSSDSADRPDGRTGQPTVKTDQHRAQGLRVDSPGRKKRGDQSKARPPSALTQPATDTPQVGHRRMRLRRDRDVIEDSWPGNASIIFAADAARVTGETWARSSTFGQGDVDLDRGTPEWVSDRRAPSRPVRVLGHGAAGRSTPRRAAPRWGKHARAGHVAGKRVDNRALSSRSS